MELNSMEVNENWCENLFGVETGMVIHVGIDDIL